MASSNLIAALQRRPKALIIALTVTMLVGVAGMQIADLWTQRQQTVSAAQHRAANAASVVAEYVRGAFAIADASLAQLAVHSRQVGGASAPPAAWQSLLESAHVTMRGSGSISVADATGIIRHSTNEKLIGASRRDQYIFRHVSRTGSDGFVVDTPILVLDGSRYVIPIGRRLSKPDGTFDGVVATSVSAEAYREFIRTMDVGKHGIVSVFHPDGVVVFREPSAKDPIGESASGSPLYQEAGQTEGKGVITGPLQAGGPRFISAYVTLKTPLIVAVSLNEDEVLAEWRHLRSTSSLAFAALTVTLGGIVFILLRQMNARARAERELREVQQLEAERLREANERLEDALTREQQARRETEAASYLKDEFLMTVSHELRTPMTAIFGWVRMLSTGAVPAAERARAVAAIERNARAQTRLIEDLLDVSRAISGKLRIDARGIDVSRVALEAVETVRPALQAKDIQFQSELQQNAPQIRADPDRVQQIVWNLLSNAIKFTPDGGTVQLRVSSTETTIDIEVADSGSGIPAEFLPYVFERFRQGDAGTRRRFGGLGLGLAIVRHLTELHGGSVSADSAGEGKGSRFLVRLPIRPGISSTPSEPAAADTARAPAGAIRLDGISVLVVDDEADARELFASILASAGARVMTAASAADAIRLIRQERELVLVSDIEMPEEDGYQLLERALTEPDVHDRRLVAIAVTAHARPADRQRALQAGFDAHLAKPVDPDDLVVTVASLVTTRVSAS